MKIYYSGEQDLNHKIITVKGKIYRINKGDNDLPLAACKALMESPVGKELAKRGALKCDMAPAKEPKKGVIDSAKEKIFGKKDSKGSKNSKK